MIFVQQPRNPPEPSLKAAPNHPRAHLAYRPQSFQLLEKPLTHFVPPVDQLLPSATEIS